ncbi:hypothetical protein FPV67DRAFT_1677610 [Lyophyllum atratum]|nr:hypothetical protein FPV67DRAFT_1677610 [Lyophyllum atratum]
MAQLDDHSSLPSSPDFLARLKYYVLGWGIVSSEMDDTIMSTNPFDPTRAIAIAAQPCVFAKPLSSTSANATKVVWATISNGVNSPIMPLNRKQLQRLASELFRYDISDFKSEQVLKPLRLAVFYNLDAIDGDDDANAIKAYLSISPAFFEAEDSFSDPLSVFYQDLQGQTLYDIQHHLGTFLDLHVNVSRQRKLRAVLSDYTWTASMSRLFNWEYLRRSPLLDLENQYRWRSTGNQFAGPFAIMAVHVLEGLCTHVLRFSVYDTKQPAGSQFFISHIKHFEVFCQTPFNDRKIKYDLLDNQFFQLLRMCYDKHLHPHYRYFGRRKEGNLVNVSIWNEAFEAYSMDVISHLRAWIIDRKDSYIGDQHAIDVLDAIPNKLSWFLLGQLPNQLPDYLVPQDTSIPVVELALLSEIAEEMADLEEPVLSYLEPILHGVTKKTSESAYTLSEIMFHAYKVIHPYTSSINQKKSVHQVFALIYASRDTVLRPMSNTNVVQPPPYFGKDSVSCSPSMGDVIVGHDNAVSEEYNQISNLLDSALCGVAPGERPKAAMISKAAWAHAPRVDIITVKQVLDHTGHAWWNDLGLRGTQKTAKLHLLSQLVYISIHVATEWDRVRFMSPPVYNLLGQIKKIAHFPTWFLLPSPPASTPYANVTQPSSFVGRRARHESDVEYHLHMVLDRLLTPPSHSIETYDHHGNQGFKLTIGGKKLWDMAVQVALESLVICKRTDLGFTHDLELLAPVSLTESQQICYQLHIPEPLVANNSEILAYMRTKDCSQESRPALYYAEYLKLWNTEEAALNGEAGISDLRYVSARSHIQWSDIPV